MISVLILSGYSDASLCTNNEVLDEISDIYVPLLLGVLRYNGIVSEAVNPTKLERLYDLQGKTNSNLIYVPFFSCCEGNSTDVSFIYTDSTSGASTSFRIATKLRSKREKEQGKVVFVNALNDGHSLRKYTPVIVDNVRFLSTAYSCDIVEKIYKLVLTAAESIAEYYGIIFRDPATA